MKKVTILTRPTNVPPVVRSKYGGHRAVTRSLIEGLEKIGYEDFNYGPGNEEEIAEQVHVLFGVNTLQYAIALKRRGKIKTLTAGPNIVVFPFEHNALLADSNIDKYFVPSEWVGRLYAEMEPCLEGKTVSWPAGVDTEAFRPDSGTVKDNTVIVYHKCESDQFRYKVCYELKRRGFSPVVFKYGGCPAAWYEANGTKPEPERYDMEDFRRALNRACFAVVISDAESQGIALAEMWSMDVPTICFEPNYFMWEWEGRFIERAGDISSCPYLSEATGMRFSSFEELGRILDTISANKKRFSPREWVLKNMSDEACARKFLQLLNMI